MRNLLVSVIMSVFNESREYLDLSIESILEQSFKDFEFIIINDNPRCHELDDVLSHWKKKDPRIIILKNTENRGLAYSLNEALKICRGVYIARMDADDISLPQRLEKQVNFLDKNTNIFLCGTGVILINEDGQEIGRVIHSGRGHPLEYLLGKITILHPTWMFRKQLLDRLIGYRNIKYAQDVDFLCRAIISGYGVSNIEEPLLKYRVYKMKNPDKDIIQFKISREIRKSVFSKRFIEDDFVINLNKKIKPPSSRFIKKCHLLSSFFHSVALELRLKNKKHFIIFYILSMVLSPYKWQYFIDKLLIQLKFLLSKNKIKNSSWIKIQR